MKWNKNEVEHLLENFNIVSSQEIADYLGRTRLSVEKKARKIGLCSNYYFSKDDVVLLAQYPNKSIKELSCILDRPKRAVIWKLKKMNIYKRSKLKWTKEEEVFLLENYTTVLMRDIVHKLGRNRNSVYCRARKLEINRGQIGIEERRHAGIGKTRKYYADSKYFSKWNAGMAYVLGLLASDGCMHKRADRRYYAISLGLHKNDSYLLQDVLDDMCASYPLFISKISNMVGFSIRDQEICSDLLSLGIVPRKSRVIKCPKVPKEYVLDFFRGVMDGDGTVYVPKPRISISTSSKDFAYGLSDLLKNIDINTYIYTCYTREHPEYSVRMTAGAIFKIAQPMYKDKKLFMKRKKDRIEQILNKKELSLQGA